MADSVKISELPSLTTPANNDVLIVNDVSDNTTKQITLQNLMTGSGNINVSLTLPAGITCTINGATVTSIPAVLYPITRGIYKLSLANNNVTAVFSNNSASEVQLVLPVSGLSTLAIQTTPVNFYVSNSYGKGALFLRSFGTSLGWYYLDTTTGNTTVTNLVIKAGESVTFTGMSISAISWDVTVSA